MGIMGLHGFALEELFVGYPRECVGGCEDLMRNCIAGCAKNATIWSEGAMRLIFPSLAAIFGLREVTQLPAGRRPPQVPMWKFFC